MDLLEFMMEWQCLAVKNMMLFNNRIIYLISLKSSITNIFSRYFAKIKFGYKDSLHIENRFPFHNVMIHNKSALNKDKNHYYYEMFSEKCSHKFS